MLSLKATTDDDVAQKRGEDVSYKHKTQGYSFVNARTRAWLVDGLENHLRRLNLPFGQPKTAPRYNILVWCASVGMQASSTVKAPKVLTLCVIIRTLQARILQS